MERVLVCQQQEEEGPLLCPVLPKGVTVDSRLAATAGNWGILPPIVPQSSLALEILGLAEQTNKMEGCQFLVILAEHHVLCELLTPQITKDGNFTHVSQKDAISSCGRIAFKMVEEDMVQMEVPVTQELVPIVWVAVEGVDEVVTTPPMGRSFLRLVTPLPEDVMFVEILHILQMPVQIDLLNAFPYMKI